VLYVGRARDLRARLRSYFRSERQRPSVETALLALGRIEWRVLGSELEAALEELRLIRELAPPANSRSRRKEHGLYLRRRGDDFVVSKRPSRLGPIASRRGASLAARALASSTADELDALLEGGPLPRLRARLAHLAEDLRYEEAARLRDRIEALEQVLERLRRLERLRALELCLIAPAVESDRHKVFFVCGGGLCAVRSPAPGADARLEVTNALALCRAARDRASDVLTPEQAEDLLLFDGFIRRPPPELAVLPLDPDLITAHVVRRRLRTAA
jgi:excinuclease UvrABC nuclease subunit